MQSAPIQARRKLSKNSFYTAVINYLALYHSGSMKSRPGFAGAQPHLLLAMGAETV